MSLDGVLKRPDLLSVEMAKLCPWTYSSEQKKIVADRRAKAALISVKVTKVDGFIEQSLLHKEVDEGGVKSPWNVNIIKITAGKDLYSYLVGHVEDDAVEALYEQ